MKLLPLAGLLVLTLVSNAKTTVIKVLDDGGAPFPEVLVIVKSLDEKREIARYLSGADGRTPAIQLGNGLYRVILTCPYGLCQTTIRELLGSNAPPELTLKAPGNPTDLHGQNIGGARIHLVLEVPGGKALGAYVLVRDPEAFWEQWYVADKDGSADFELPCDPAVVVVVYQGKVYTSTVTAGVRDRREPITPQNDPLLSPRRTIIVRLDADIL